MAELDSIQIEKSAVTFLKQVILPHKRMNDFINDNDKEPSWDGMIYLYKEDAYKAEDILCRVPVQIKGKNEPDKLKRKGITYPIEFKHLRNYDIDGGVVYFVVIVSNDCMKYQIFYNCLTPIKLQDLLKGMEKKEPDNTKSVPMMRLENNDMYELYKILEQFHIDSKKQGNSKSQIMKHSIGSEKIKNIDSISWTACVNDYDEMFEKINIGEVCIYGHDVVTDTWYPFTYEEQKKLELIRCIKLDRPFGVDKQFFYDSVIMEDKSGEKLIRLSENLVINDTKKKYCFQPISRLDLIEKDILFLKALRFGKTITVGLKYSINLGEVIFTEDFLKYLAWLEMLIVAFQEYDIRCTKRMDEFTNCDWKNIDYLIKIHSSGVSKNYASNWLVMWWEDRAYPLFIAEGLDGNKKAYNLLSASKFWMSAEQDNQHYIIPNFFMYKRDIWEKIYNFEDSVVLEQLERCDYNLNTQDIYYSLFVELLSAYDNIRNEKLYKVAKYLADKFEEINPKDQNGIINKLQLIKRKRIFTDAEISQLEEIEQSPCSDMIYCAVEILLENRYIAKKQIEALSSENKEKFKSFPIFNLLEN